MNKTIEIGKDNPNSPHRHLMKTNPQIRMFVCSTPHLRDLLIRHAKKLVADCNYVHTWRDAKGYGLCLGYSAPQPVDPKARAEAEARRRAQRALYRNPSYDPMM